MKKRKKERKKERKKDIGNYLLISFSSFLIYEMKESDIKLQNYFPFIAIIEIAGMEEIKSFLSLSKLFVLWTSSKMII